MTQRIFAALAPAMTLALPLGGCAGGEASHLPHPLALPGQAISAGVSNAAYGARRRAVASHVAAHHGAILAELEGPGIRPQLSRAMDLARVAQARRPALAAELRSDMPLYASQEPMVVTLMVYGR
ncbi:hypothetical protein IV417_05155 [Alphaproteobacteria bacterium KMM 3653]|uniref:Lipoprotein n=1 Tax=Harenicola maris TaxID=2841044 RepID=A0AAP2CPA4_9RHOB|nr:hypothetical protein [Harenicola maris]